MTSSSEEYNLGNAKRLVVPSELLLKSDAKILEHQSNTIKIHIDKDLLKFKAFFLLFFAGFGSTFPYLSVYFKQIGLNPWYVGILAGVRPLIQFVSGPFWAFLADKYKARKAILLFSILSWLVMTLLLAFPRPHNEVCKLTNVSHPVLQVVSEKSAPKATKKNVIPAAGFQVHFGEILYLDKCLNCEGHDDSAMSLVKRRSERDPSTSGDHKNVRLPANLSMHFKATATEHIETSRREDVTFVRTNSAQERNKIEEKSVTRQEGKRYQVEYVIQRDQNEIRDIFIVLLVLIVVGEFLEAPSFIMIDTALLEHLGEERKHYGKTRLFGSIGYGLASFSIGAVLDLFKFEFCGKEQTNYIIIFYFFSAFMIVAFLFGLFFVKFAYVETKERTNPIALLQVFATLKYGSFLGITLFMGFFHGSIMNFLNWFLEDLGASKLMMGIATACRCSAIIFGFFTSSYFIDVFGHIQLVCWSLASYVISYFGYSMLTNPWWAIPIEVVQGLIYAISWSACITYLGDVAPANTAATMQGVLQGVYWGLGTGTGAIAGGLVINRVGVVKSFRLGGVLSSIVFVLFCMLQCYLHAEDVKVRLAGEKKKHAAK